MKVSNNESDSGIFRAVDKNGMADRATFSSVDTETHRKVQICFR